MTSNKVILTFLSMRPKQWTKNVLLFAPLVFSQNMFDWVLLLKTISAFFIFCLISGSIYIFNDIIDVEKDRKHPRKSKRPLASGQIQKKEVFIAGFVIMAVALAASILFLNTLFLITAIFYIILQIAYSTFLKHIVILDVFSISAGFLLRVVAGAEAIEVTFSTWLLFCTILLSLFLALSKRRHELILLEGNAIEHRKILFEYSPQLLDQMISIVTTATVIAYILYTISDETVAKFGTDNLKYTVPFVLYGIFRYLYLIHQKQEGGSPEWVLLNDKPILFTVILYGATASLIIYAANLF